MSRNELQSYITIEPEKVIELCQKKLEKITANYKQGLEQDAQKIYQKRNLTPFFNLPMTDLFARLFKGKISLEQARDQAKGSLMKSVREGWQMIGKEKVLKLLHLAKLAVKENKELHLTSEDYNTIR